MRRTGRRLLASARAAAALGAAALGTAALLGAGCSPRGSEHPPSPERSIVLVTLDTFRADHLGCAGHPRVRTPFLDRLARRGTQWSEAVSAIPLTTPSHATILTGWTPRAHGLLKNRMRLDAARVTVAEALRERGFRTAAIVSNATVLSPELHLDQGFASYRVVEPAQRPASGEGRETARAANEILASESAPGLFLWTHFFDAHLPYLPPPPFDRMYRGLRPSGAAKPGAPDRGAPRDSAELYAGEISFLDGGVGRLARTIEETGAFEHTSLIVTADHGEGLGEHGGYYGHDTQLYETSLRVPLVIAGAGADAGRVDAEPARTTDLFATVLALAGVPRQSRPASEGRDLFGDAPPAGDGLAFVAETHPAREKATPSYALRTGAEKVIWEPRHGRREMYDLARDPGERVDLGANPSEVFRMLGEDLELDLRNRPVGRSETIDDVRGGPDEATREALESLGYAGG